MRTLTPGNKLAWLRHPIAPSAVGQNHGFGHHQVEGRTALANADLHLLISFGFSAVIA
jgi:hypothetical protein